MNNSAPVTEDFQKRVQPWMIACFGAAIAADKVERNHRFFEEATEAVQANGMTRSEAHQLVDYTFDRPVGELHQEVGGVMVTLAALCLASGEDMHAAGETELARIWTKVEQIRAKQAAKPKHSPLPESPAILQAATRDAPADPFGEYRRGVREAFDLANMINANRQGRNDKETCSYIVRRLAELANGGIAPKGDGND